MSKPKSIKKKDIDYSTMKKYLTLGACTIAVFYMIYHMGLYRKLPNFKAHDSVSVPTPSLECTLDSSHYTNWVGSNR